MLSKYNKKKLKEMAKRMRVAANVPKDSLRLEALIPTQVPTDDEETTLGLVFTRKRKAVAAPTEHSHSDGRAPSHHDAPSEGQTPLRDMVVIQEGEAESLRRPNLWNPNLDDPSYLKKVLLRTEEREKLMTRDESYLIREAIRQFGQALAISCLTASKVNKRITAEELRIQETSSSAKRWKICKTSSNIPRISNKKVSDSWLRRPKSLQTKLKRLRQKGEGSWLRSKNLKGS